MNKLDFEDVCRTQKSLVYQLQLSVQYRSNKKAREIGNARAQVSDRAGAATFTIDFLGASAIANYLTQQGLDNQTR